jgi:hypothetical protein
VVRALDAAGVSVDDVELRQPSLDDVFFVLTGRTVESGDSEDGEGPNGHGAVPTSLPKDLDNPAVVGPRPGPDLQEASL